jgi:hypothetical protein
VDTYSGAEILINEKYGNLLCIYFFAFTFGFGLPVLFPLSLICLIMYYIFEKILTVYFYQKPPMFDDKLTKGVLKLMKYAVLLYVTFGYWMLSNR